VNTSFDLDRELGIFELRASFLDHTTTKALATHRQAVAAIQSDPDATDCAFYTAQKAG